MVKSSPGNLLEEIVNALGKMHAFILLSQGNGGVVLQVLIMQ